MEYPRDGMQKSPIIDIQDLGRRVLEDIPETELRALGKQLIETCQTCGFVGFSNHGIPLQILDNHHEAANKFFALPREEKLKSKRNMDTLQGFTDGHIENLASLTKNRKSATDFKETFDMVNLDLPLPENVPELRSTGKECMSTIWSFAKKLFRIIELALDWEPGMLGNLHKELPNGLTTLRALRYPAVPSADLGSVRCGAHKDMTTFSLQFQTNAGGFQIFHENEWINADAGPGIITFFFGDTMEVLSGHEIKSMMHRVIVNEEVVRNTEPRNSIIFFICAARDQTIQTYSGPIQQTPMNAYDFIMERLLLYYP